MRSPVHDEYILVMVLQAFVKKLIYALNGKIDTKPPIARSSNGLVKYSGGGGGRKVGSK